MDVEIGRIDANLDRALAKLHKAAQNGAELVIFPECALSGYCFRSLEEAAPYALAWPGDFWKALHDSCRALEVTAVIGFLEAYRGQYHNSALLHGPLADGRDGAVYRKTHLPTLGLDRFITPGAQLVTCQTPRGVIAPLICYDIRFPEAARVLGLQGADIIALPTNWPEGAESSPDFITRARAWEGRVYVLAANRVGVERGRRFIGRSQIVAPTGEILAEAGGSEETILYADLDLSLPRRKRIVIEPGEWELDITGDRRPELYGTLTETATEK
jgi:predicted amidohydrolase